MGTSPIQPTGASAPVFFRPPANFTMQEIFLRRKKSCCTAQPVRLRDRKTHFLSRNDECNPLIKNN